MRTPFILLCVFSFIGLQAQKEAEVTERLKADIKYLSSDQLEGRLSGSTGERRSSYFIADEFRRNKLQPMGDTGSYFQNFNLVRLRISQNRNPVIIRAGFGRMVGIRHDKGEFYPLAQSCNEDSVQNWEVYQAGYGIYAPELNHNDYKDTQGMKGKVFVIKTGSPEAGNPHGRYEPYEGINYKVDLAIKMGARGVVFINTDTALENPKGFLDRTVTPRSIPVIFIKGHNDDLLSAMTITFKVKIVQMNSTAHNVIGYINNKKKSTIVIGAHQDHLGYNEFGGSRDTKGGSIHNGADDNASGVAMMMELMREIRKNKKLKKHNYVFIAFSGEEQGLLGSNYFMKHPTIDTSLISYMLNFDMVGRLDSVKKTLMIYGVGTSPVWKKAINKLSIDTADIKVKTTESGTGSSDHTSFYYANIPVLHFFTGQHYDYHMPSDDEEKINYHGMFLVYNVTLQMIKSVNKEKSFPFTATKAEETEKMNFKVTLGIMPDYVYDGNGLRVDGVSLDKPAQKAGILKGDIITKMGDYTISSMKDYMAALGKFKKGETITVVVTRGTETKQLQVTF